jgi:hypothetical protein
MSLFCRKLLLLIFLVSALGQQALMAQTRFTATINPSTIGKNETAELKLIIENAGRAEQMIPPSLKNFIVVSGPNQESGMQNINGVIKQYIGVTYLLRPKAKGNFKIGAASIIADGKLLKTTPLTLEVTNATTNNNQNNSGSPFSGFSLFDEPVQPQTDTRDFVLRKGENIQAKIAKNIFIKVDVDKTNCYIGEPVVVSYKLFTRLRSESNITKNPSFNGFSVIDLGRPGSSYYTIEKLNGRAYNVYTLRKSQLYPLQAGDMDIATIEVDNNIHFIKEDYLKSHRLGNNDIDSWERIGVPSDALQEEKVTLQSKPIVINVKPLPDTNKPASFRGAVGNFTMETDVEKNKLTTDDAGKYQVLVSGQGNVELVIAPEIKWPDGIESYEPKIDESLNKQAVPVSGHKSFVYPFTASKAGTYTLPAAQFSYFDPSAKVYKTLTGKPIVITVTKGKGKANPSKNYAVATGNGHFTDTVFTNRMWFIFPVILIIFSGLFLWIKAENKKEKARAILFQQQAEKAAMNVSETPRGNPLVNTEASLILNDGKGFYKALNNELRQFLAGQLAVPVETINKKGIAEELDKKGVAVSTSLQIQQLLNDVEWQLYTPFSNEDKMQEMYQAANTIVHAFESLSANGRI